MAWFLFKWIVLAASLWYRRTREIRIKSYKHSIKTHISKNRPVPVHHCYWRKCSPGKIEKEAGKDQIVTTETSRELLQRAEDSGATVHRELAWGHPFMDGHTQQRLETVRRFLLRE